MYLGLDLGTSGLKAMLIDEHQKVIASADAPLTVQRLHHGWSEQNPSDWIAACKIAVGRLAERHPAELSAVKASACPATCMVRPWWTPPATF
nr:FGGY family carbohydrate kinase [Marinicella sp. W31]MDC2879902.1 FGGY family carbohydrate kinase [Marinicella sp. W31]